MSRQGANLKLTFPFSAPTAAAVFHRADTLWIVFDSTSAIDLAALVGEASRTIRGAEFSRDRDAGIVRLQLDHPHLSSISTDGAGWSVTIGDAVADPTHALDITRNLIGPTRASVTVSFDQPHQVHRIRDPEIGDDLLVVTGFAPARGFINEQDFVEFRALASTQGIVIEPLADDLHVELAADKIVVGRPGGLTLSSSLQSVLHGSALRPVMFDAQVWGLDRQSIYGERQSQLIAAAAASAAPAAKRLQQRLDLARFYIARDMYPEAKGVLDVVLREGHPAAEDVTASVLRAVAEVMMNRPDAALKDLANPAIGDQHDAPLWRALAYAGQGKWALARDSFKRVEATVATLPVELQRVALRSEMRAAIEVGDFAGAADELNDLKTIGLRTSCSRRCPCWSADCPKAWAATRRRWPLIGRRRIPGTARQRRRAGCARRLCVTSSAISNVRTSFPSWRRSPRSGGATKPRSERWRSWRGSTPRRAATAIRSTSCAAPWRRIRTPI
jgi:hypothetical protein